MAGSGTDCRQGEFHGGLLKTRFLYTRYRTSRPCAAQVNCRGWKAIKLAGCYSASGRTQQARAALPAQPVRQEQSQQKTATALLLESLT